MGMGRTNQRFQQGGPVNAPRWSPAQQEAWRGRQAAPPPDISLPRWGAPQAPPVGIPPMGPPAKPWQPPAGRLPPLDPYDPGRGIPNPPVPSPSPWAGRVSGLERPGATRDWRGQQWTMGGAGPNQWTDRLGRGWGRNDGGLTSLYWPGGRVY